MYSRWLSPSTERRTTRKAPSGAIAFSTGTARTGSLLQGEKHPLQPQSIAFRACHRRGFGCSWRAARRCLILPRLVCTTNRTEPLVSSSLALVAPQGFEPRYAAPEAAVLPLNEGAMPRQKKTGGPLNLSIVKAQGTPVNATTGFTLLDARNAPKLRDAASGLRRLSKCLRGGGTPP